MIKRLFNWIKSNKLTFLLLVVVAYLISKSLGQVTPVFERSASVNTMYTGFGGGMMNSVGSAGIAPKNDDRFLYANNNSRHTKARNH